METTWGRCNVLLTILKRELKETLNKEKVFDLVTLLIRVEVEIEFASSNELWRASLDVIDFMPLASANYSGGMIITDWYADSNNPNESIKITIRFLTNEIRSDALDIKIFYKKCNTVNNCLIDEKTGPLAKELKKEILKIAAKYKKEGDVKNFKPYVMSLPKD